MSLRELVSCWPAPLHGRFNADEGGLHQVILMHSVMR